MYLIRVDLTVHATIAIKQPKIDSIIVGRVCTGATIRPHNLGVTGAIGVTRAP